MSFYVFYGSDTMRNTEGIQVKKTLAKKNMNVSEKTLNVLLCLLWFRQNEEYQRYSSLKIYISMVQPNNKKL